MSAGSGNPGGPTSLSGPLQQLLAVSLVIHGLVPCGTSFGIVWETTCGDACGAWVDLAIPFLIAKLVFLGLSIASAIGVAVGSAWGWHTTRVYLLLTLVPTSSLILIVIGAPVDLRYLLLVVPGLVMLWMLHRPSIRSWCGVTR